jgi:hypothetical protein
MRRLAPVVLLAAQVASAAAPWTELEPGLELGAFEASHRSEYGDSVIRVLRIDPERFSLRLLNASAPGQERLRTARQWVEENGLVAAINASMYQEDYRRSVSLMRTKDHVNNGWLSRDRTVLAFDRLDDSVPAVQIIDRDCQDFDALRPKYASLVQSIRMVSCTGRNVWAPQDRRWSTAAVGTDGAGRVLFIHVRSPYTTHELIEMLLALPIELRRAMYVEGGTQAQLYVHAASGGELEFVGSHGSRSDGGAENTHAWPVPNVLGVARRP